MTVNKMSRNTNSNSRLIILGTALLLLQLRKCLMASAITGGNDGGDATTQTPIWYDALGDDL
jgi:hypothetical protein